MKKLFFFALALSLFVPLGVAQTETDVNMTNGYTTANPSRAFGDSLWSSSVEGATASVYNLGVTFDGTSYWVSVGAPAGGQCSFVTMDQAGTLVNSFFQPAGCDNSWGIRDLAYDAANNRIYGGCDAWNPGYINSFKKIDGSFTNVKYGPHLDPGMTVCRAVAFDDNNQCFYSANWSSAVFKCSLTNNVTQLVAATGLSCYGAACEESTAATKLWLWWYDANGDHGTEIDVDTKTYTGKTFDGLAGATAGGACAYEIAGGNWELVAMHQSSPDTIEAYDLGFGAAPDLAVDVASIDAHVGGTATFSLANGPANRDYLIWASMTDGLFLLPGGLPLGFAWDSITSTFLSTTIAGSPLTPFLGTLDGAGMGSAVLTIPGHTSPPLMEDLPLMFVYSTYDPFDFVSNIVDVLIVAFVPPPPGYQYDDGSTEDALGWSAGGHTMWGHCFDALAGDTITSVDVAFGWNGGTTVLDGLAAEIYILEDPNDDCDPIDAVLVHTINTVIANSNTDTFMHFDGFSAAVTGKFFVAVHVDLGVAGGWAAGMDSTSGYNVGESFFSTAADPAGLPTATTYEMSAIGYPAHWMIRANL